MNLLDECVRKFGEFPPGEMPTLPTGDELELIVTRVRRGITIMDLNVPYWRDHVTSDFNMRDPGNCVATQATERVTDGPERNSAYSAALVYAGFEEVQGGDEEEYEWAITHGFDSPDGDYSVLDPVWRIALGFPVMVYI